MAYVGKLKNDDNSPVLGISWTEGRYLLAGEVSVAYRTFAHEIGHIITGTGESVTPSQFFYPSTWALAWRRVGNDAYVVSRRRVALEHVNAATKFIHHNPASDSP